MHIWDFLFLIELLTHHISMFFIFFLLRTKRKKNRINFKPHTDERDYGKPNVGEGEKSYLPLVKPLKCPEIKSIQFTEFPKKGTKIDISVRGMIN